MKIKIPEVKEKNKGWNPYIAGIWLGLLAIISVYLTTTLLGKSTYLGASTTFVRAAGFLFQTIDPEHVAENAYYAKEKVKLDWQFFVIIGVLIGAFISSKLDKSFKLESVLSSLETKIWWLCCKTSSLFCARWNCCYDWRKTCRWLPEWTRFEWDDATFNEFILCNGYVFWFRNISC